MFQKYFIFLYPISSNWKYEFKKNQNKIQKINKYLYLVKLKGTYYEMGIQYGKMMKKILQNDVLVLKKFLNENNDIYYPKIPEIYRKNNLLESLLNYYLSIETKIY